MTTTTPSFVVTSGTGSKPLVEIKNTANDATSGELKFITDRPSGAAGVNGDVLGLITFFGDDDTSGSPVSQAFGQIEVQSKAVAAGSEEGELRIGLATTAAGAIAPA